MFSVIFRRSLFAQRAFTFRRFASTSKGSSSPASSVSKGSPTSASSTSRVTRIESRLPRFLAHYLAPLRDAPFSHVSAFLILHELTAIVPLFGLAAAFHYYNWLPPYISEGKWVSEGVQKFGSWMRKRGWIGQEDKQGKLWLRGESGVRIVVELATAYAITKAFLPLRLILSVWATPWFARWTVLPIRNRMWKLFGKSPAATTPIKPVTVPSTTTGDALVRVKK